MEHLGQNIYREWLLDGKICAYRGVTATRNAIDIWVTDIRANLDRLTIGQKLYVLNDLTTNPMMMTPYAQQALRDLTQYKPELHGATAIIMKSSPTTVLMRVFMSAIAHENHHPHIFFRQEEALDWLQTRLTPAHA